MLLLACCLLAAAVAKPGRSTLDTKKGYKTKTGSTSSVTLTLTRHRRHRADPSVQMAKAKAQLAATWSGTELVCAAVQQARQNTELCGDDHAPVTRGRMRAQYALPHGLTPGWTPPYPRPPPPPRPLAGTPPQTPIKSPLEWYRTGLRGSAARQSTELCGDDHAPVTRGRMRAQYPLPHGLQTPGWTPPEF